MTKLNPEMMQLKTDHTLVRLITLSYPQIFNLHSYF